MSIGEKDARILIQRPTDVIDGQGSVTQTWASLASCWAKTKPTASAETANGNERSASAGMAFTVRYQSLLEDLTTKDRVNWDGMLYDILTADPMPPARPVEIQITARRKAD